MKKLTQIEEFKTSLDATCKALNKDLLKEVNKLYKENSTKSKISNFLKKYLENFKLIEKDSSFQGFRNLILVSEGSTYYFNKQK